MTITDMQSEVLRPAQVRPSRPGRPLLTVVGFDGSAPSLAALEAAAQLIDGRNGHLEIVYVAHLPGYASMSAEAIVGIRDGFDVIARELNATAGAVVDDHDPLWHFQRRDGLVTEELLAAASELQLQRGPDATIVIIVGASAHLAHHVAGSVSVALARDAGFPVLVVPPKPAARHPVTAQTPNTTTMSEEQRLSRSAHPDHHLVERDTALLVLRRVGFSAERIDRVLAELAFPVSLAQLERRLEKFGITKGSLIDLIGGSP